MRDHLMEALRVAATRFSGGGGHRQRCRSLILQRGGITPRPELGAIDYDMPIRQDIEGMARWIEDWRVIWNMPKPVVAAVHGHCLGEGWDLAVNCDMVVAADDATFGYPITRSLGSPMSHLFTYLAGPQWARYLLCSGDSVDGVTAARIGLAMRSVPAADLGGTVAAMAERMAGVPNDLHSAHKSIVNKALDLMEESPPTVGCRERRCRPQV